MGVKFWYGDSKKDKSWEEGYSGSQHTGSVAESSAYQLGQLTARVDRLEDPQLQSEWKSFDRCSPPPPEPAGTIEYQGQKFTHDQFRWKYVRLEEDNAKLRAINMEPVNVDVEYLGKIYSREETRAMLDTGRRVEECLRDNLSVAESKLAVVKEQLESEKRLREASKKRADERVDYLRKQVQEFASRHAGQKETIRTLEMERESRAKKLREACEENEALRAEFVELRNGLKTDVFNYEGREYSHQSIRRMLDVSRGRRTKNVETIRQTANEVRNLKEAARALNEQLTESREENRRLRVTSVGVEINVKLADELNLAKQRLKDFEKFRFYGWCNPAVPGSFVPKGAEETLTDGFIDRQGYTKRLYQEP